jgi:hypothetical protein
VFDQCHGSGAPNRYRVCEGPRCGGVDLDGLGFRLRRSLRLAKDLGGYIAEVGFHPFRECRCLQNALLAVRDDKQVDKSHDSGLSEPCELC